MNHVIVELTDAEMAKLDQMRVYFDKGSASGTIRYLIDKVWEEDGGLITVKNIMDGVLGSLEV